MNPYQVGCAKFLQLLTFLLLLGSCSDSESKSSIVWNESRDGELSGDLSTPTPIAFSKGNNRVVAASTPAAAMECSQLDLSAFGGVSDQIVPWQPGHEIYTDVFTFEIPEGNTLAKIIVEKLEMQPVHTKEKYPCLPSPEESLGAFTAISHHNQIDWNSDSPLNFISTPVEYPLAGIALVNLKGIDLLEKFKSEFPYPEYAGINRPDLVVGPGKHTFWWKEGAYNTSYILNFVLE